MHKTHTLTFTQALRNLCKQILTFTNRIRGWGAGIQHFPLFAGAAGDAGLPRALLVRVRVAVARLAHRVMIKVTAVQHTLTHGTHGAGFAPLCDFTLEVAIIAHAGGIIRVRAGRIHAEQALGIVARRAGLTRLRVTEVF